MPVMNMIEAIRGTLGAEMERDERVVLLGQDIGRNGGVFRATEGLQERFGADRVVDMPLAEAVIVGSAVGLAMSGLRPVPELQFLGFGSQAFHQIEGQVARMRYRSQGRYPMPMVIRAPFGGNVRTPELHSDAHEAKYANCPGLKVVMPATAADAKGLLTTALRDDDPVLFCEPLRGYRLVKDEVPEGDHAVPFGRARMARPGTDVTLVTYGATVQRALAAANQIAEEKGISVEVIDLRSLSPWDQETVYASVKKTSRVIVAYEDSISWGYGAEIAARIADDCFAWLDAPVKRVASTDTFVGYAPSLEDAILPQVETFRKAYEDIAAY